MRISAIVLISMWLACGCNKPAETRADAEPEAVNMTATPTNAGWVLYSELPASTSFVSVRLTYVDGRSSRIQRFDQFER